MIKRGRKDHKASEKWGELRPRPPKVHSPASLPVVPPELVAAPKRSILQDPVLVLNSTFEIFM